LHAHTDYEGNHCTIVTVPKGDQPPEYEAPSLMFVDPTYTLIDEGQDGGSPPDKQLPRTDLHTSEWMSQSISATGER